MIRSQDEPTGEALAGVATPAKKSRSRNQHLVALEQELRQALGAKVSIKETARGRGKIVIQFSTAEEFERLRAHLMAPEALQRAG